MTVDQLADTLTAIIDRTGDFLASTPPFSWLDAALRGSVGPES